MFRFSLLAVLVAGFTGSVSSAQDVANPVHTSFATVGRPTIPTWMGGRLIDAKHDRMDWYPCCGYGKTHDDMGVTGTRATIVQYWGGSCEFFAENCRRPTAPRDPVPYQGPTGYWQGGRGCKSCGQ